MADFTVNDIPYRTRHKLNARQQFHIARRIAPVVSVIGAVLPMLQAALAQQTMTPETEGVSEEGQARAMAQRVSDLEALGRPIMEALGRLSDPDCDYVLDLCLSVVQRYQGSNGSGAWADVWSVRASRIVFEDIELPEMMQIAMEVLRENLMGFFSTRRTVPTVPTMAATAPMSTG